MIFPSNEYLKVFYAQVQQLGEYTLEFHTQWLYIVLRGIYSFRFLTYDFFVVNRMSVL